MKITFTCESSDNQITSSIEASEFKFDELVDLFKAFLVMMGHHPGMINTVFDNDE